MKVALCCLALAATAAAAQTPGAGTAALTLQGRGPYYTVAIPQALHRAADLGTLQLLNARGEALPFAWGPAPVADLPVRHSAVAFFKLPGVASSAPKPAPAQGWVLDLRSTGPSLQTLDLRLPDSARGFYTVSVEASDDLQQWRTVQPAVQLLSLEHQGQRLVSTRVELDGIHARYLRLKPLAGSALPELAGAEVSSVDTTSAPEPVDWSAPIAATACGPRFCDYTLPAALPLQQVELVLGEPNTVGSVQLLGRIEPGHHHGRHHHALRALHHKSEPEDAAWWPLATLNAYWLRGPEGEARNGRVTLSGDLHTQLRLQTDGPISQLGTRPPLLRLGTTARSLVFLAREPAPYRLAWGQPGPAAPAMALSQLMPGRKDSDALPADTASVALPMPPAAAASAPTASNPSAATKQQPWLWAVLLLGLGLMDGMAWTLLRKPAKAVDGPDSRA
jgi:hypothetical protein